MDINMLEKRYLRVTRKCAKLAGIWPEQSKKSKYIMRVIAYMFVTSSVSTQIARIVCFFNMDTVIQQISFLSATVLVLIKQGNYIFNADKYKQLINGIRRDWMIDRPSEEADIILLYAERGYLFILIYLANVIFCLILFIQMPVSPRILDIILPKNESRELAYVYPAYYAVDEHKYHVYITLHMSLQIGVVAYTYTACDTSLMYSVQHACGLLAVAGHRFKTAIGEMFDEKNAGCQGEIYRRVCHSIQGHQHALRYLKDIQNAHDSYLFICMGISMMCFSLTLVKVSKTDICIELAQDYTFAVVQLVHMLYLTLQGQFVINTSDKVMESIYEALWYNSRKRSQMLFVLVLRNCFSPPLLTAGGIITLNLQSFSEILKASVSYFTVLKSA